MREIVNGIFYVMRAGCPAAAAERPAAMGRDEARRIGRQHRQAAGVAAWAPPIKRGVTRLRPHISRQSAQGPLRPQVRKYRRNALSDVMGQ